MAARARLPKRPRRHGNGIFTEPKIKGITVILTGNGLYPQKQKIKGELKHRPYYNFQTPEGLEKVFGPTYLVKQLRETGKFIEITVNILAPPQVFDHPTTDRGYNPNTMMTLHGAINEVEYRDLPDRGATFANLRKLNSVDDWLDSLRLGSDGDANNKSPLIGDDEDYDQVVVSELLVIGLNCSGTNGKSLPKVLKRIGTQFPNMKINIVDINETGQQENYLYRRTNIEKKSQMKRIVQDSRAYLQGRLQKELRRTGQHIKTIVGNPNREITSQMMNECFTTKANDGSDVRMMKPCPTSDDVVANVYRWMVQDNGYQIPVDDTTNALVKTRSQKKALATSNANPNVASIPPLPAPTRPRPPNKKRKRKSRVASDNLLAENTHFRGVTSMNFRGALATASQDVPFDTEIQELLLPASADDDDFPGPMDENDDEDDVIETEASIPKVSVACAAHTYRAQEAPDFASGTRRAKLSGKESVRTSHHLAASDEENRDPVQPSAVKAPPTTSAAANKTRKNLSLKNMTWEGPPKPNEKIKTWPHGWVQRTFERAGHHGSPYHYFYSPDESVFRSLKEVHNYLENHQMASVQKHALPLLEHPTFDLQGFLTDPAAWVNATEEYVQFEPPLTGTISAPLPNDVVCRRGTTFKNHQGNVFFRQLVGAFLPVYAKSNTATKKKMLKCVVYTVRRMGGRFLGHLNGGDAWTNLDNAVARDKAAKALSDAVSKKGSKGKAMSAACLNTASAGVLASSSGANDSNTN